MKSTSQYHQRILNAVMLSAPNAGANPYDATTKVGPFQAIILLSNSAMRGAFPAFADQADQRQLWERQSNYLADKCGIGNLDDLSSLIHWGAEDIANTLPGNFPASSGGGRISQAIKGYLKYLVRLIKFWVNRYEGDDDPTSPGLNPDSRATHSLLWWYCHLAQWEDEVSITVPKSTDSDALVFGTDFHELQIFLDGFERLMKRQGLIVGACVAFTYNIANDAAAQVLLTSVLAQHQDIIRGIGGFTFVHESIAYITQHYLTGATRMATSAKLVREFKEYNFSKGKLPYQSHRNQLNYLLKGLDTCGTPMAQHNRREYLLDAISNSDMDKDLDRKVFDNTAMNELEQISCVDEGWEERFMNLLGIKYRMWLERMELLKGRPTRGKKGEKSQADVLLALTDKVDALTRQGSAKRSFGGGQRNGDSPKRRKGDGTRRNFVDPDTYKEQAEQIQEELTKVKKDFNAGAITKEKRDELRDAIRQRYKPFMTNPTF
ncbi:hypothetical protein TrRE_jg1710 [Triparma retinervis]|uniref:Uncharacterized protein n=1 Tax=Triparma retinervis TaxID=2557542 RepID=A0A9W7DU99_9STRA|nr:hypothetical protein TrRE_jg1710 [Triparma retinervis]